MIQFTIKTLDSNNHHFSVEDEMTVQELKEKIRDEMGIEINMQRLIFYGRVLQDEQKLSECDVNGKVVHLVQRLPPSPRSRQRSPSSSTNTSTTNTEGNNISMQQQIRRLMALTGQPDYMHEQQQAMSLSPTTGRMEFIRRSIVEIRAALADLRAHVSGEVNSGAPASSEAPAEAMDTEPSTVTRQEEREQLPDDSREELPDAATRVQNARRRAIRGLRTRHSRPRDLGLLLDELEILQEQFTPHRLDYLRILTATNSQNPVQLSEEERRSTQIMVDMITDIMHSFAHVFHAVSDIYLHVGQRNSRLTAEPSVMRHPIPMQAHINVVQASRRQAQSQQQPQANNSNVSTNRSTSNNASATQPGTNTTTPSGSQGHAQGAIGNPPTPQAGRNTTQPTVNINIQPDPVSYQVEIETRVPIAFPLESALLNGLTNVPGATNQQQSDQSQLNPGAQQSQTNRRQVLFDFENLFRGLGQAGNLGGVEVVMSMEEIPQAGSMGPSNSGSSANSSGAQQNDSGVYIAPMPWGGPPSADLLQNIVSSVIRQGLVPGFEGVTVHVPGQQIPSNLMPDQENPEVAQSAPEQETGSQNAPPRQGNLHLRRATTTTRAQVMPMVNLVYDRFLQCDSHHARRRLQRRREQYQEEVAAHERQRAEREARQNIETIRTRNTGLTERHIQTMVQLLNRAPSAESWFNALLVAVARHVYLSSTVIGETPLVPHEFQQLRLLLRSYIQSLLTRSGCADGENAFEAVADFFVHEHSEFIENLHNITLIRPNVDVYHSLRTFVRSRLPAIIATVMSESNTETFATRFYALFGRLFIDLLTLFTYFSNNGVSGMIAIFKVYLALMIQSFDDDIRDMMETLARANYDGIPNDLLTNLEAIQQYIRRTEFEPPEFYRNSGNVILSSPLGNTSVLGTQQTTIPGRCVAPAYRSQNTMEQAAMQTSEQAAMQTTEQPDICSPEQPTVHQTDQSAFCTPEQPVTAVPESSPLCTLAQSALDTPEQSSISSSDLTGFTKQELNGMETNLFDASTSEMSTSNELSNPRRESVDMTPVIPAVASTSIDTIMNQTYVLQSDEPLVTDESNMSKDSKEDSSMLPPRNPPDSNNYLVPPVVIVQNWDEDWIPVFSRDQQSQNGDDQEPYSDAYLSGMPSRKRRCLRQSPTTLDDFMNDSVHEAAEYNTPEVNDAVRNSFREHMRHLGRSRASRSQDYDPLHYTSAARFLNPRRSSRSQSSERSSDGNKDSS